MNSSVLAAIYAKAKGSAPFSAGVDGPWTPSQVPAGDTFPYGVYAVVGNAALDWAANQTSVEPIRIQFSVYSQGGEKIALDYASQIASAFAPGTSLTLSSGHSLGCMPIFGPTPIPCIKQASDGTPVFHAVVDIRVWFQNN
jgi:hypothetical protein